LDVPLGLLALTVGMGVAASPLPAASAGRAWGILLGLAIFYGIVNSAAANRERVVGSLTAIGLAVTVVGLVGTDWSAAPAVPLLWLDGAYQLLPLLAQRVPGGALGAALDLANPREVGGSLSLVFPLLMIRLCRRRAAAEYRSWGFAGAAVATGVMGAVLVLSQALSAIAGVLVALWGSAIVADRARRRWWIAGGLILCAITLAAVWPRLGGLSLVRDTLALPAQPPPGTAHAAFGVAARLELWPRALRMIGDAPYTGIGLGMFPWVMDRFYSGFILGPERHAHSFFLQIALDLGLPGLVTVVWLLGAFARHLRADYRSSSDSAGRATTLGLGAGLLAYLVFGTIDVVALGAKPALALWIMLGLGMAPHRRMPPVTAGQPTLNWGLHVGSAVLMALALLVPISWDGPHLNVGRVLAHRALLPPDGSAAAAAADETELGVAATSLEQAARVGPGNSGTWYLLAALAARRGEDEEALAALEWGVMVDSHAPLQRYALAEALSRPAGGTDWPALLRVYRQWTMRYPRRAEWYAASAIATCRGQGDRQGALVLLERGRAAVAQPAGLLEAYRARLVGGEAC
ncbi:MAG: O-antigen ligase family protein, partial [Chloroflexota bacterium]|nr:O-antigen ligase family protein [Chloroflexota bacterium]